jgi:long-subunit fatty acid transport protein
MEVLMKGIFMKRTLITTLTIFIMVGLNAYSLKDLYLGTEVTHHDARMAALGGTGVSGGFTLMDSSVNPANLYFLDSKISFQLSYSMIKNSENRAVPLWNFFDSYIDESTYARNEHFYNEAALGVHYSLDLHHAKLGAAFIFRPIMNFGAGYMEEVRNDENQDFDNFPPIIAKNFIESKGILGSYNFLLNFGMPLPFENTAISVGAEISYITGKHENETRVHWTDFARNRVVGLEDVVYSAENKISGMGFKMGLNTQIDQRTRFGLSYQPKISLKSDFSQSDANPTLTSPPSSVFNDKYIIPSRLRFGVLYMPRNPFRTNFQVDFELINYSEIGKFTFYEDFEKSYDDGYALRVGMEHYVGRAVPLRLGFSHSTARQNKTISLPAVSIGTGFKVLNNFTVDLAGEYGRREFSAVDLFPDGFYNYRDLWSNNYRPEDRGWDKPDKVTESFLKIFASVRYEF